MVVQIQVLSVNSVEMAPCLLLSTESQRCIPAMYHSMQ